jgi:hypothetical protein
LLTVHKIKTTLLLLLLLLVITSPNHFLFSLFLFLFEVDIIFILPKQQSTTYNKMILSVKFQQFVALTLLLSTNVPSVKSFATRHPTSHVAAIAKLSTASSTTVSQLSTTRQIILKTKTTNYRNVLYMTSDAALPAEGGSSDDDSSASSSSGDEAGGATVTQLIFNLVKGIVGAGVLSLPAGIAAWGSAPSAAVPAVALIAAIGILSGYGFALIGRCCAYTNTKSYRDAWSATVSESSSWIPAFTVTFKTICAILAYSMILGDTFVSLLSTAGFAATKVPVTIGLTGAILLPLCLMKNLSSLAPFSLVGSLGMLYTAIAMSIRFFGKAYSPTGKFGLDMAESLRPKFGAVGAEGIFSPNAAILVGMLSTAYMVREDRLVWLCCVAFFVAFFCLDFYSYQSFIVILVRIRFLN